MTTVIGFLTKDGCVIATDSQMTDEQEEIKRGGSQKLFRVKFRDGTAALLARAGSIEGSDLFQDSFATLASQTDVTDARTIAVTAETALKETKNKLLQNARKSHFTPKLRRQYSRDRFHRLFLAYAFKTEHYLYSGESAGALLARVFQTPVAIGSGKHIAKNALAEIDTQTLAIRDGVGLGVHAISMCKRLDLFSSGDTQIGTITNDGWVEVYGKEVMQALELIESDLHTEMTKALQRAIHSRFYDFPIPDEKAMDEMIQEMVEKHRLKRAARAARSAIRKASPGNSG